MANEIPKEVIEQLKEDIRSEASKKIAGWTIATTVGLMAFAAFGAWTILKPTIASQLGVVPLEEIKKLAGNIPSGAVVPFDGSSYEKLSSDRLSSGCPQGWVRFIQAESRFILGSDAYPSDGETGTYALRAEGGEKEVSLTTPDQLPSHGHTASASAGHRILQAKNFPNDTAITNASSGTDRYIEFSGEAINITVGATGKGAPHNNMPPYVALYYCKKN